MKDDGRDSHTIEAEISIPAKGYGVFCKNSNVSENGGVNCTYQYSKFSLANESDEIIIEKDGELAKLVYSKSSHPLSSGKSMELEGSSWHAATSQFGKGDYGTPGVGNSPAATPTSPPIPTNTPTLKPTKIPTQIPTKSEPTVTSLPTIKKILNKEQAEDLGRKEAVPTYHFQESTPIVQEVQAAQGEILGKADDQKAGISKIFFTAGLATFLLSIATAYYIHSRS